MGDLSAGVVAPDSLGVWVAVCLVKPKFGLGECGVLVVNRACRGSVEVGLVLVRVSGVGVLRLLSGVGSRGVE